MSAQSTETPTSAAPAPAGIVVEFEQKVTVTQQVNLDRLFESLDEHERAEYFKTDLTEFGYSHEFERPLAYLTALADADVTTILGHYKGVTESVDNDFAESRVTRRDDVRAKFEHREWTRADFESLAVTAPWIKPEIPWEDMTEEQRTDLLRAPGPNDVPLALDWSGLVAL
jgi:hypothetical protein